MFVQKPTSRKLSLSVKSVSFFLGSDLKFLPIVCVPLKQQLLNMCLVFGANAPNVVDG